MFSNFSPNLVPFMR